MILARIRNGLVARNGIAIAAFSLALFVFSTLPANAQLGATVTVEAPGPLLSAAVAGASANTVSAGNSTTQTLIEKVLNGLAWSAAKATLNSITKSTVNWINSGFSGSPAFVTDLNKNLSNLQDAIAQQFFAQLNQASIAATGFNIISPFQDQLNSKLRTAYYQQASSHGLNPYTLNQCSQNPTAFLNQGRFSQGGFNAWFCANQNPANNPWGAYLQASNALWSELDTATETRKQELEWGSGLLSYRGKCTTTAAVTPPPINTTITQQEQDNIATSLGLSPSGSSNSTPAAAAASKPATLSTAEQCPNNPIQTPGSVLASQIDKAVGLPQDTLNLADDINEVVGALMSQLVNQVLGPGGLSGASQPSSGGGASYIAQAADPSQTATQTASLADGFVDTLNDEQTNVNEYGAQWQTILDAANAAQQKCGTQSDITAVITQANTEIARVATANNQINSLVSQIQAAKASANSTTISTILSQNTAMLTVSPVSPTDLAYATTQSTDSGSSTPPSLLTQMTNKQKTCATVAP